MSFLEHNEYQREWFKTPRGRYHQHKSKAKARGIPFLLPFLEWWDIWQESGKWERRGTLGHQYVMARLGDQGAYERSNVRICLSGENTDEMREALLPRTRRTVHEKRAANRVAAAAARHKRGHVIVDRRRSDNALGRRMVTRDGARCWAHPSDPDYPDAR